MIKKIERKFIKKKKSKILKENLEIKIKLLNLSRKKSPRKSMQQIPISPSSHIIFTISDVFSIIFHIFFSGINCHFRFNLPLHMMLCIHMTISRGNFFLENFHQHTRVIFLYIQYVAGSCVSA